MTVVGLRRTRDALWFRVTLGALVALVVTLVVVVVAVYELTILSERRDLDALLIREGDVLAEQMSTDIAALVEGSGPSGAVDAADLESIASRALALHPGSSLHLSTIRVGDVLLSSARGPERLEALRDAGNLPDPDDGVLKSEAGIRARSLAIRLGNTTVAVEVIGDDAHITADSRTIAARTLIAALIGAGVGVVGLAVAVRRTTRPLGSVSDTVRRTRMEDLSARVDGVQGSGEISALGRDVNAMLDDLAEARAVRGQLIASVSHELRTPLAAARGHTDLLREGRATDVESTVARIDRELGRITRLVDDLLALSRASDPAWLLRRLVSAQSLLDDLADRVKVLGSPNIEIDRAPDVMIEVDPDRILQALWNLVSNAVVHTPEGTAVTVRSRIQGGSIGFAVADTGRGLPADVIARFGDAFVRGSEQGTGLGLAVCKAVATAHHGSLEVRSDGSGTTVTLAIPVGAE